jgi:hypothetical protein
MGYLGDGRYDLLEMLKASKNPQINYEGLYEEPADTSINLDPMYNMGSRQFGDMRMGMPQATGIMQQAPQGIFNDFYGSVYEPYNEEKDDEQVDYLPGQSSFKDKISNIGSSFMQKSGIGGLLGLITGNPLIGLIGKGIGALANRAGPALNDFRSASTGAQFFQNLRDRRAREDAAARGLAKQQEIARQTAIQAMTTNQAYGGGGGGFDTSAADRAGTSAGSGQGFSNKSGRGRTGF